MKTIKIRIPKPEIKCSIDGSCYAWACDHKGMGYCTLGDTAEEAVDKFKQLIDDGIINEESAAGWLNAKYNNAIIVY